jgi:hypothetical protein
VSKISITNITNTGFCQSCIIRKRSLNTFIYYYFINKMGSGLFWFNHYYFIIIPWFTKLHNSSYEYCCSGTWPVIGIVVGCGVMISIIITIVCCCRKSQGNRGMVCQTNPRTTTTVVTAGG